MRGIAIVIISVVVLTGCQALLTVDHKRPTTVKRDRERLPSEDPLATVTHDSAKTVWTVTVTQPYRVTTETLTIQPQAVRRYLGWPLAPLSGLFQCPLDVIGASLSDRSGWTTLRQIGCMRLLGMEPLKNVADRDLQTDTRTIDQEVIAPVPGIAITFVPDNNPEETIRLFTNKEGTTTLSQNNFATAHNQVIRGSLSL